MTILAGIEAGGTKFICALGNEDGKLLDKIQIATQDPGQTMDRVVSYFSQVKGAIAALGVATFGPIDPDPQSKTYGYITSTPKSGWSNFDIIGCLRASLNMPIGFDTDVNAAALGEAYWGAAQTLTDFIYLTVGTGIGGGAMVGGQLLHGVMHSEMGHIFIPQDLEKDPFPGICPYHKNCLEGLASGPAISQRWQVNASLDLPADHPAWALEADYLGYALANYIKILSPKKIILGGGVMQQTHLLPKIRERIRQYVNGYVNNQMMVNLEETVVAPGLEQNSGVVGAFALAAAALKTGKRQYMSINTVGQTYTKPWGSYITLAMEDGFQLKILTVIPGGRLSLQKHFKRSEHWVVVQGTPTITLNETVRTYQINEAIYIPVKAVHRIENDTETMVKIVEVQVGQYLGEDDIVRLDDIYDRAAGVT